MRLSVIIPMYNCAPVIERCLDSIDPIADTEVIVVDDGSVDNGGTIVQQYTKEHPYVRLVQKANGGVSSARNVGIETATGNYIMFVDADDYLMHGGLERILNLAEKETADVIKYKISRSADNCPSISSFEISHTTISGKGNALAGASVSDFHVVDGLFKRKLVIENNIRFHEDLYLHEDDVFMAELYAVSERVIATTLPLYHYVVCSTYSHTHNTSPERTKKIIDSELLAVKYRCMATERLKNAEVDSLERIKAMRFVYSCSHNMLAAGYPFSQYKAMLNQFKPYGCYPLQYQWLKVCLSVTPKLILKTFLCNHPLLAWITYRHRR